MHQLVTKRKRKKGEEKENYPSLLVFFSIFLVFFIVHSVGEQEDVQGLANETECLPQYVAKGIALGCFVYARCLHHGLGVQQNREQAKYWYSRVGTCVVTVLSLSGGNR